MRENNFEKNIKNQEGVQRTRRTARIDKNEKKKKPKKKWSKRKKIIIFSILGVLLLAIVVLGIVFGTYVYKAEGNLQDAVLNMAQDVVGEQDPIFVLLLGISADIKTELTDTIILCGYNPQTQKAFMLSIPRDTFVGNNEEKAGGYDKINAKIQKSAEKTVESVELLTGVHIDNYVIVRNISITSIFECIGSIDFDVPINMNYDDPTQDLHIHLKKGYQTLEPNQVEQLLRFRHNNDGTSYPSSYGDNDYGRMKTQREFISTVVDQLISINNVGKLKDIASMIYTNLQTNMSGYKVLDYVPYGLKFKTSDLISEQLPGSSSMINNLWFYKASSAGIKKTMNELIASLEMTDEQVKEHYKEITWVSTPTKNSTGNNNSATHVHTWEILSDTSSCISDGEQKVICSECLETDTIHVTAKGHTWSKFVTSSDGKYQERTCSICGTTDKKILSDISSSDSDNKKDESTNTTTDKNNSNTTVPETPTPSDPTTDHIHNYKSSVTKAATCKEKGVITNSCSGCGSSYTEDIPVTDSHSYADGVCSVCGREDPNKKPSEPEPGPGPNEGDNSDEKSEENP